MVEHKTSENAVLYAEEALVVDVQSFLHRMMIEKAMSRSQLAEAMGITKARVSQIFSDECKNFTIKLLARAVHAMGERVEITSPCCQQLDGAEEESERKALIAASSNVSRLWRNENEEEDRRLKEDGIFECPTGDGRLSAAIESLARKTRIFGGSVG